MKIGFIGLGKMGSRMVLKLLKEGHEIVVWNRSNAPVQELKFKIQNSKFKIEIKNLKVAETIGDLVNSLESPRVVWLMLPAGSVTQSTLDELSQFVKRGDIVIDGANSNYKDTQKSFEELKKKEIRFLGIGVSGGIIAEKNGYPLMVGGEKSAYEFIQPILDSLVKPNGGYEYFGVGGAGHFTKMVHNGIEYGMMQAIAEGFGVLQKSEYHLDLVKIASLWQKGTIVSGFLMDRAKEALEKDPNLDNVSGNVPRGGEGDWTVREAKKQGVIIEVIEKAVDFRKRSEKDKAVQDSFTAKMINALRNAFGGHKVDMTL